MSTQRAFERKPAFVPAKILLDLPGSSGYCTVRDLSTGGAKLAFASVPRLPDTFDLHIPSQAKVHTVEVRWQRGLQVGVRFKESRRVSVSEDAILSAASSRSTSFR